MTVAQFQQTNYTTQTGTAYPLAIDADWAVAARLVDNFAPHAQVTPNLTVGVDAGHIFNGTTLSEVAAQTTGTFTAPVSNPRIDRVVIDRFTGTLSVVAGTENVSPSPPAIPAGTLPVAQVYLTVGMAAIGNTSITDERDLGALGTPSSLFFSSSSSLTIGAGTQTLMIEAGCYLPVGLPILLLDSANGTNWMQGFVSSYNSSTGALTVDVLTISGAGTFSAWWLFIAGYNIATFTGDSGSGGQPGLVPAPPAGSAAANYALLANGTFGAISAFTTGDVKITIKTVADAGWVMMNDGTIGSATSGGTTRANADCQALFELLWSNVSNSYCPVSGGRGASAAADWSANKTIQLPLALGRALAVAGAGSGLTSYALGQTTGENTHTLTQAEMPSHSHSVGSGGGSKGVGTWCGPTCALPVGVGETTGAAGGSGAHNNMQPTSFLNVMLKL